MKRIDKLNPFGRFCCTIGNLPTSYMESLTYEQQILWLCKYIKENVTNNINTLNEAVIELQNYLLNLDLQEEVDNKLDRMAESGELEEIISRFLEIKSILCFDNINDLKNSENVIDGSYARTLGYNLKNDGGSGLYKIRTIINTDVVDEGSIVSINNENLVAELISDKYINVESFGCYSSEILDSTDKIKKAVNYCKNNNKILSSNGGTYLITEDLIIDGCNISFNFGKIKSNQKKITLTGSKHLWDYEGDNIFTIEKIKFEDTNLITNSPSIVVKELEFIDWHDSALTINQVRNVSYIYYNNNRSDLNTVSITINATDKNISHLEGRGGFTGIVINAVNTTISDSQLWLGDVNRVNDTLDGSKFIYVKSGTGLQFSNCISDTYQYAMFFDGNGIRGSLSNFQVINNNTLYNNANLHFINKFEPLIGDAIFRLTNFSTNNNIFTIGSPCFLNIQYFDGTPSDANILTDNNLIKNLFQDYSGNSIADNITLNNNPSIKINNGIMLINLDITFNNPNLQRFYIDTSGISGMEKIRGYSYINLLNTHEGNDDYGVASINRASNNKILISSLTTGNIKRVAFSLVLNMYL